MFAIAFDLNVAEADRSHPKTSRQAYKDIETTLKRFGFVRVQWSVYAADKEDLAKLIGAVVALRELPWFAPCVKKFRAFRMDLGSDLLETLQD